jgi:hypothetical protein
MLTSSDEGRGRAHRTRPRFSLRLESDMSEKKISGEMAWRGGNVHSSTAGAMKELQKDKKGNCSCIRNAQA